MTSSWLVGPLFQSLFVLKTLNLSFFLFFNSSVFKILVNTFPSSLSNKVAMYHGLHPLICLGGWICSCVRWVQERNWTFYHLGFCLLWRSLCLVSAMEAIFFFSLLWIGWVSLLMVCQLYRHRMNCLSAGVEDSAYIISRNAQKDNRVQLSDFIFWWDHEGK